MYDFLQRYLPDKTALIVLGAWYAGLLVLILLFGAAPEATIRYMNI